MENTLKGLKILLFMWVSKKNKQIKKGNGYVVKQFLVKEVII